MSATVRYKGSVLTEVNDETKTLNTAGTWLEDNIEITDTNSGGSGGLVYQDAEGYIVLGDGSDTTGEYTALIVGTGDSSYCYVELVGGSKYYTDGDVFTFSSGDSLKFRLDYVSAELRLNGKQIAYHSPSDSTATITKTISDILYDIIITIDVSSSMKSINIDARAKLNITSDDTYLLGGYDAAIVDTKVNSILDKTISGVYENSTIRLLGKHAFDGCSGLTSVSFASLSSIASYAFYQCSNLVSAYMPSLKYIGDYAFAYCSKLSGIPNNNLSTIGSSAFYQCSALTEITLTATTLNGIGFSAFVRCSNLSKIDLPNCTTFLSNGYGNWAFQSCTALQIISAPKVTRMGGSGAFTYCTALTNVEFPALTSFLSYAQGMFGSCSNLSSVSFPLLANYIPSYMFTNCISLVNVYAPLATMISEGAFISCRALSNISLPSVTNIGSSAFRYCSSLVSVTFSSTLSNIGSYAFAGCSSLTSFIGPNIVNIGQYAFSGCSNLSYVDVRGVTYINASTFNGCSNLKSIFLPFASSIGASAFYNCFSLHTLIIGPDATASSGTLPAYALANCRQLLSLYLLTSYVFSVVSTAIYSTPISTYTTYTDGVRGTIYVPESLYSTYITKAIWSVHQSRIVSMTDSEIEALLSTFN